MKGRSSSSPSLDDDLPLSYLLYVLGALVLMVVLAGALICFVVL